MVGSIFERCTFPSDCVYNPPTKGGGTLTGQAEIILSRKLTEEQEMQIQLIAYAEWAMTRVCNS